MITITINAPRGTRVSTPRPSACYAPIAHIAALAPFGDRTWAGVRVDGDTTAMGQSAWSPPI